MNYTKLIKYILACLICLQSSNNLFCQTANVKNKIISINGFFGGKIPYSKIKDVKQLDILSPYKLVSAIVYFSSGLGTNCTVGSTLVKSNIFNKDFLEIWARLGIESIVTFENIKILKPDGTIAEVIGVSFVVVKDK